MVRAVLFDFHNTMVISDCWLSLEIHTLPRQVLRRLAEMDLTMYDSKSADLAEQGYREVRLEVHRTGREVDAVAGVSTALKFLNLNIPDGLLESIIEDLERECLDDIQLRKGLIGTLDWLRDQGIVMGVVSNAAYGKFVEWSLDKLDLRRYFGTVLTTDIHGYYKSRPEIFLDALTNLGHTPEDSVHIGDSYKFDIVGAKKAGMRAIWLDLGRPEQLVDWFPDATISEIWEVPPIIEGWNGAVGSEG